MVALRTLYAALLSTAVLACSDARDAGEPSLSTSSPAPPPTAETHAAAGAAAPSRADGRRTRGEEGFVGAAAGKAVGAPTVAPEMPPPAPQQPGAPVQQTTAVDPAAASMIIRTGLATLQVDSLELAIARVRQLVQGVPGAYVANTSLETGEHQVRRATVEVKIPAAHFDRVVAGLQPLGKVEGINITAQDVTEEFVDVSARVENARRLESRLIDLLANRTGRLQDVLSVERELARVREEIERYEGRMRFLRTRAAISTLTVALHEPLPILGARPEGNPIAEAFRDSWRNFVGFVAGFISLLGILVPLGALLFLLWLGVRWYRRTYMSPGTAPSVRPGAGGTGAM